MLWENYLATICAVMCNLFFYQYVSEGFGLNISRYVFFAVGVGCTVLFCIFLMPDTYYPLLFLILFLMHFLMMVVFCQGDLKMKVYTAGFAVFHLMIIEGILYSLFSCIVKINLSEVISVPQIRLKIVSLSFLISMAYLYYLKRSGFPNYLSYLKNKVSTINVLLYSEFILGAILAYAMGVYYIEEGSYLLNNFFIGLYLMAAVVYYLLMSYSVKLRRAIDDSQNKKRVLEEQLHRQLDHYESQASYIERFRRFKHDYRNQLKGLSYMVEGGDIAQIKDYVHSLSDELNVAMGTYVQYSDNRILDSMFQEFAALCRNRGIRFEASVHIEQNFGLTDIDFCTVFSNILNNAMEAVQKLPEDHDRFICVEGKRKGKWNVVVCRNSFDGIIKKDGDTFLTTKSDSISHGIGLSKIREIIEAHSGIVNIEPDGGVFSLTLCMAPGGEPCKEEEEEV